MEKIPENGPKHIAIILDGNRRWARKKGLPVSAGHKAGGDNLLKKSLDVRGILMLQK